MEAVHLGLLSLNSARERHVDVIENLHSHMALE
jgi:hypothetical protein